ncbi:MAG: hypothetical protein ABSH32_07610 [Bryobacteraceae bacterium]
MIAASSGLCNAGMGANQVSSPAALPGSSGSSGTPTAGGFWSFLDGCPDMDFSKDLFGPDPGPAPEEKRNREGQSVPVAVTLLPGNASLPVLDWGWSLPAAELPNSPTAAAAPHTAPNLPSAESQRPPAGFFPAQPQQMRNPQVAAGRAEGTSELAFAARLLQPAGDPPSETAALTPPSSDSRTALLPSILPPGPARVPGAATSHQAAPGPEADAEQPVEPPQGAAANADASADQGDPSQVPVASAKVAPPAREGDRSDPAQAEQPVAKIVPGAPLPVATDRDGPSSPAPQAKDVNTVRPPEPEPILPPVQPPSHDVSLRLADGQSSVDIRMTERAGEIRVLVQTPDHELANSLRSELPDLVGKLRQSGFNAETWRPAPLAQTDGGRRSGADSSAGSSQQHSAGARKDGRQQQKQQQDQPRWVGEWQLSLDPAQEAST